MKESNDAIRRAIAALGGEDADAHPGYEVLEAYVDGRLSPEERAGVERLAKRSSIVAEDIADLRAMSGALQLETSHHDVSRSGQARREVRWSRLAIGAGIAASLLVVVWIARPSRVQAPTRVMTELTPREEAGVKLAITSGRIALPDSLASLRPAEGTLLGSTSAAAFRLQSPVGTAVIETRPLFAWDDAASEAYTVAVFDSSFSEVARGRVTGTSWRSEVDLARDATYSWQVTAHRGAQNITEPQPPRPEARFHIVDAVTVNQVDELRRRLDNQPLALGVLLAERGLIAEARLALMRAQSIPDTADAARRLIGSLDQGTPTTTKPAQ